MRENLNFVGCRPITTTIFPLNPLQLTLNLKIIKISKITRTAPFSKFAKSIMLLDGVTEEVRMIEDDRFNFTNTRTVVVGTKLYAFKRGSPVSAHKIADFTSSENLVKTTLPTLPRHKDLS